MARERWLWQAVVIRVAIAAPVLAQAGGGGGSRGRGWALQPSRMHLHEAAARVQDRDWRASKSCKSSAHGCRWLQGGRRWRRDCCEDRGESPGQRRALTTPVGGRKKKKRVRGGRGINTRRKRWGSEWPALIRPGPSGRRNDTSPAHRFHTRAPCTLLPWPAFLSEEESL